MYYYNPYQNDFLVHYGVKGMKWGVRHDYEPIGRKRRSKNQTENDPSQKDSIQSDKKKWSTKKKVLVAGAAIVAAYATYKFVDSGSATRLMAKGKSFISGKNVVEFKQNSSLSDQNMSADDIMNKVVSRINPDYGKIGTKNNCRRCTYAYEMSRRGFDVKATRSVASTGQNTIGTYNMLKSTTKKSGTSTIGIFETLVKEQASNTSKSSTSLTTFMDNVKSRKLDGKSSKDVASKLFDVLSNQPDRSRGEVSFDWSVGGGHSIAYEIINNKPVLFDCQSGKSFKNTDDLLSYFGDVISSANYSRLDNVSLDFDQLLKWVQNA